MKELVVSKIREGTVIDHINAGKALLVLKILGIDAGTNLTVSMAMNVPSSKMGKKDILKVEGMYISEEKLNKIALISPNATINLVRDYEIERKFKVRPPEVVEGVLKCPNLMCVSNAEREPVRSIFYVKIEENEVSARCHYCGRKIKDLANHII
ncbi:MULTISPECIES: aspartate carbamoyltransferase regulatory subunit [unclassified Archaeoglobus]|uniref:aspartate carbamoyltransferase regulatory subunit n=1 Tax=unclassified Archaeoglobus TaxID=2643606 RepID=UPI0025BFCF96|nr:MULTISPECIES: aspartate carbamoyltransferase regulatory subunit [unclassified Archaeoglobus]